jgi:hypothetical protein
MVIDFISRVDLRPHPSGEVPLPNYWLCSKQVGNLTGVKIPIVALVPMTIKIS